MGTILSVKCKCGFKFEGLQLGCGMEDFHSHYEPCVCKKCAKILSVKINQLSKGSEKCPVCDEELFFYSEDDLQSEKNSPHFIGDKFLKHIDNDPFLSKKCYCPKCKEKELVFFWSGIFD